MYEYLNEDLDKEDGDEGLHSDNDQPDEPYRNKLDLTYILNDMDIMELGSEEEPDRDKGDDDDDDDDDDDEDDIYAKYNIPLEGKSSKQKKILLFAGFIKTYFNETAHSIAEFLETLNYNAVLTPLMEFDYAIKAHDFIKNAKAQAGAYCGLIISAVDNRKNAVETAIALMEYWTIMPEFEQYVHLQAVETRVSRALLMLSSSKAYHWVVSIATEAVELPSDETWAGRLAKDVQREWRAQSHGQSGQQEVIFDSKKYLPSLTVSCEARVMLKRWTVKDEEERLTIIQLTSFIIETWLRFPISKRLNENYKVRCALISIVTKYMPVTVLLLDDVWKMYLKPYIFLIHGRRSGQRISPSHTQKILALFENSIQNHAMTTSTSDEYQLLMVLKEYSETWFRQTTSRTQTENQGVSGPNDNVRFFLYRNILFF
jgi:hypothetical protein